MSFSFMRVMALTVVVLLALPAYAEPETSSDFIQSLADTALEIIKDQDQSEHERLQKLADLAELKVDFAWVSRFVLGRYARKMSDEQIETFSDLHKRFTIQNYVSRFREYSDEQVEVTSSKTQEYANRTDYFVKTKIIRRGGAPILVDYRVRETDEGFKIFDLVVEGVSLLTSQRSEFGSVIQRSGVDRLNELLATKVQKLEAR